MKTYSFLLASVIFTVANTAHAVTIYKYVLPNGTVLYSQTELKKTKPVKVLRLQSETSIAKQEQRNARRELERLQVRADRLSLLSAAKEMADNAACSPPSSVAPPTISPSVLTPLPGERTGTVGGGSRLNDAYWDRMRSTLGPRYESREQLDQALAAAGISPQ